MVGIDPRDPVAVRSIPALAAYGALGVRFNLGATPVETAEDLAGLDTMVDEAANADVVIQSTVPLAAIHVVERAARRRPDARQVLDHLGLPGDAGDLSGLAHVQAVATHPSVNIELSGDVSLSRIGYPYRDVWSWAEGVLGAFGPERTMWASDWPLAGESASYADHLALVGLLPFLDADARSEILGGTARRVWRGSGSGRAEFAINLPRSDPCPGVAPGRASPATRSRRSSAARARRIRRDEFTVLRGHRSVLHCGRVASCKQSAIATEESAAIEEGNSSSAMTR